MQVRALVPPELERADVGEAGPLEAKARERGGGGMEIAERLAQRAPLAREAAECLIERRERRAALLA